MKSIISIFSTAVIALIFSTSAFGQKTYSFSINYTPSLPIGDVADFTDDFAWRGVAVDARFFVNDQTTVGFYTGWEVFRSESSGVVTEQVQIDESVTATISAKQFRFTNSIPLLLTSHFHWGESGDARPYIGLGAGMYYITQRVEMGLYALEDKTTRFGLAPSAGVMLPLSYDTYVNLGLQYNYAFSAKDYTPVSYLSFCVGLCWGD